MLRILSVLAAFFWLATGYAQGIEFEDAPWKEVVAKAKKAKKPIYMDIYAEWCGPCKMMARNIFPAKEVGDVYNAEFINFKIDAEKGEGIDLAKKYQVTAYPTNLYIDPENETILLKSIGATDINGFLQRADQALAEFNDTMTLGVYAAQFKKGKKSKDFLQAYIEKMNRSDLFADEILDSYLKRYGKNASDEDLDFLLANTKTFDNNAIAYLASHKERINKLNKEKSADYFSDWLQQVPYGTFQKAVKNKDEALIDLLHENLLKYDFPTNIYGKHGLRIIYFQQLGDQMKAAQLGNALSDYLSNLPKEEYAKQNEIELRQVKKAIAQQIAASGRQDLDQEAVVNSTLDAHPEYAFSANLAAAQKLNESALSVYNDPQAGPQSLSKALAWSSKAADLTKTLPQWPVYGDTQALILYRSGRKNEAIQLQEEVVRTAESQQGSGELNVAEFKQTLERMKDATL